MNMIITSECEKCIHSIINERNKAEIEVYCKIKDKKYRWDNVSLVNIKR